MTEQQLRRFCQVLCQRRQYHHLYDQDIRSLSASFSLVQVLNMILSMRPNVYHVQLFQATSSSYSIHKTHQKILTFHRHRINPVLKFYHFLSQTFSLLDHFHLNFLLSCHFRSRDSQNISACCRIAYFVHKAICKSAG